MMVARLPFPKALFTRYVPAAGTAVGLIDRWVEDARPSDHMRLMPQPGRTRPA